jgi:putative membrane protein
VTGLVRAFGGVEKGAAHYLHNHFFLMKMALLAFILALEVWPMATFIKWRIRGARGETIDATAAQTFARISVLEAILVVLMVLAATAMARGYGAAAGSHRSAPVACSAASASTPANSSSRSSTTTRCT